MAKYLAIIWLLGIFAVPTARGGNAVTATPTGSPLPEESNLDDEIALADTLNPFFRWAVFPFDAADDKLKIAAEKGWWNAREKITSKKRFLVASKQLLIQKDVFEP